MHSNIIKLQLHEILQYSKLLEEEGDIQNWEDILSLQDYPKPIVYIRVLNEENKEVACAVWGWRNNELRFGKVSVLDDHRCQKIGPVLMKMVIAIAKFYKASKITGTIAGEDFLFDWYRKLGFNVIDGNKLLMEFS